MTGPASGNGASTACRVCGEPLSEARAALRLTLCSGACHQRAQMPQPGVLERARAAYGDRMTPRLEAAARALDTAAKPEQASS